MNLISMQEDQFQRLLPTFIQVIDLTEQEESEYWTVVSAIFEGKPIASIESHPGSNFYNRPSSNPLTSASPEASIYHKVCGQSQILFALSNSRIVQCLHSFVLDYIFASVTFLTKFITSVDSFDVTNLLRAFIIAMETNAAGRITW